MPDWATSGPSYTWSHYHQRYRTWIEDSNVHIREDDRVLSVHGIPVGTITWLGMSPGKFGSKTKVAIQEFQDSIMSYGGFGESYIGVGDKSEAFFRTIISDLIWSGPKHYLRARPEEYLSLQKWWDRSKNDTWRTVRTMPGNSLQDQREDIQSIENAITTRRAFVTHEGYMGIAPKRALVGDQVFALKGGSMPFLLRPAGERTFLELDGTITRSRRFTFVDDCYCHGVMDGEAVKRFSDRIELVSLV